MKTIRAASIPDNKASKTWPLLCSPLEYKTPILGTRNAANEGIALPLSSKIRFFLPLLTTINLLTVTHAKYSPTPLNQYTHEPWVLRNTERSKNNTRLAISQKVI